MATVAQEAEALEPPPLCQPDVIPQFIQTLSGRSEHTKRIYRGVLGVFQSYLPVPLELASLPELHAALTLFSHRYSKSRLHTCKAALRGLLRSLGRRDDADSIPNPRTHWQPPQGPDPNEIDRALTACETDTERTLVLCFYSTAGRLGELFGDPRVRKPPTQIGDIDWKNGTVRVIGKGDRPDYLVFYLRRSETMIALRRHLGGRTHGPIFEFRRTKAYNTIRAIGERAGLKLHPHLLRHATCDNSRRQRAGDVFEISRVMRNKLETTALYFHVTKDDLIARAREREWR